MLPNLDPSNYLLPTKYIESKVYQSERSLEPPEFGNTFTYDIPLRIPGNYSLIFQFMDSKYKFQGKRSFNIYIENYLFKTNYDIIKESGGQYVPIYEIFEFYYRNDAIIVKDKLIYDLRDKITIKVTFTGKSPMVNGILLYNGTRACIISINYILFSE